MNRYNKTGVFPDAKIKTISLTLLFLFCFLKFRTSKMLILRLPFQGLIVRYIKFWFNPLTKAFFTESTKLYPHNYFINQTYYSTHLPNWGFYDLRISDFCLRFAK